VSVCLGLNSIAEVALAALSKTTLRVYKSKLVAFFKFCRESNYSDPFAKPALESYLMSLWRKGNKFQSPESFRSALRKFCIVNDRPDPFTPKMTLMVKSFKLDAPYKQKRFLRIRELRKLMRLVRESKNEFWSDVLGLIFFSIWQNVRISTLLKIKMNDFFTKSGGIYLNLVKGHKGSVWTILHPLAEEIFKKRFRRLGCKLNAKLAGNWCEASLNVMFKEMCLAAGIPSHSWHDLRHTSTQYLNDLGYPNLLMQCLGTWRVDYSMKHYLRQRTPIAFSQKTLSQHKAHISSLSERLQRVRGKMLWLLPRDAEK
jgi:hypothetical protein